MGNTPLTDTEITTALGQLDGWQRDGDKITKTFEFDTYLAGCAFAVTAGTVAEGFGHHPDMTVGWRKVTLDFTTHDAGHKISGKDIEVAKAIDNLPYPKKK